MHQFACLINGWLIVNLRLLVRNKMTCPVRASKALPNRLIRGAVISTQDWLDGLSCFLEVIVRHIQENVMRHMGTNVMMNEIDKPVVAINSR